ncbi:hypothetical protein IG631_01908 [Alternaria alternata]|nr:hypothetical protein IG631_01908 [Alternaria alternata]
MGSMEDCLSRLSSQSQDVTLQTQVRDSFFEFAWCGARWFSRLLFGASDRTAPTCGSFSASAMSVQARQPLVNIPPSQSG